ncbi:MAG: hypothetical protein JNJ63_10810 [Hyphomonadaceae bacterium]|nr:hypothetical protein [Hyphomonadaceae bacterium]
MTSLAETYRPFLGQRIASLAWRPITCDTPGTVADLNKPILEFSGAASLFFDEGGEVLLTWMSGADGDYHLAAADLSAWRPFSLDLIHASPEQPWAQFIGARLRQVSLYRDAINPGEIVAVRHEFDSTAAKSDLWLGVGQRHAMHEGDDLVACIGPPLNADELALVETIATQ